MNTEHAKKTGVVLGWTLVLGLIIYGIGWAIHAPASKERGSSGNTTSIQPLATSGIVEINDREWKGAKCDDPNMHFVWNMLTDDVRWEVRLNRDDNRVFPCYPANWKPGSSLNITVPFNVVEWRIVPGQAITKGSVSWSVKPKNS